MKGILRGIVNCLLYLALIVVTIILFIGFYGVLAFVQEKLFVKGPYITYMIKSPYSYFMFLILFLVGVKIYSFIFKKKDLLPGKYLVATVIILGYILITSVIVVTEEGIYDYSFYNLKGQAYNFSDIKVVNTGFKDRGRKKGEFFYDVQLENGKTLKLAFPSMTQPGKQYDNDTWQEYVDIDELIMDKGAEKISSEKGFEYVRMDQVYTNKLLKVIRNK